jgi:hypothetical protein
MLKRTSAAALVVAGLAALAGCKAGTRFSGALDLVQWRPDLQSSALKDGGDSFDLVTSGGVGNDEALWAFDASFGVQTAGADALKPYRFNLGYWQKIYRGIGPGGVTFAGAPLGAGTKTSADFAYYKFTLEDPDVRSGSGGPASVTGGLLGVHFLDFSVVADDGVSRGVFADGAPMFVLGYRIEQYAKGGLMYYVCIEGMDLDAVPLGDVSGSVMDLSAGMRWFIRNDKAAISVGYRKLEAALNIGSNRLSLDMDGAVFSLYMRW